MNKYILLIILCLLSIKLFANDKITLDSLLINLKYAKADSQKVDVLCRLSDYYLNHDLSKSLEYSHKAIDIASKKGRASQMAFVQSKRGQQFLLSGDYDMALKLLFSSLKIYEETNDFLSLYKVYNSIGAIYDRIHDYDKALDFYFKAVNSFNKQSLEDKLERVNLNSIYNNIGNVYNSKNELETALEYYQKALDLSKPQDDYKIMGSIYNNLGKLHSIQENYDEAYIYLQNSLDCRERINDKDGLAKTYSFFGNYYMMVGEEAMALESLQKSLLLGEEVGSLDTQNLAYYLMFGIYEGKGQLGKALEMHKLFKQTSDSLINQNTIQEITKARMQFDFAKKEKLTQAEEQEIRFKFWLTISILTLGFLVIGLLYGLLKVNSKRMKLKQEHILLEKTNLETDLDLKNKELTTNVMYLLKKNELIESISQRITNLKSQMKKENQGMIQKIIFDLQAGADQKVWEEFEVRFENVHNDFYKTLRDRFPEITPSDEKLAAFLRLGMSTKEISAITHQSIKSLEVARTRLRKRLKLTNTDTNLLTFLAEI